MSQFLETWKKWKPSNSGDMILRSDAPAIDRLRLDNQVVRYDTWEYFYKNFAPREKGDARLHTSLLPMPFVGNLNSARVVLLLLNPGLSPSDYYAEMEVPSFKERVRRNLRQDFHCEEYPFFPLDPSLSWQAGATYWTRKLSQVVLHCAHTWRCDLSEAKKRIANNLAAIELVPYHSASYGLKPKVESMLHSVALAKEYVHRELLPKAKDGRVLLVVMRKRIAWSLPSLERGVVTFSGGMSRAAHLSVKDKASPGARIAKALIQDCS